MRRNPKTGRPLIERSVEDDNFAHVLHLVGMCAAWSEAVREGHRVDFNDVNMIHIPTEVALAFMKECAKDQGKLGEASRSALEYLKASREATAPPTTNT